MFIELNFRARINLQKGNILISFRYFFNKTLKAFMTEEINKTHEGLEDLSEIIDEHQLILDSIKSGNVSKAKKAFNAHMESKCFQVLNAKVKVLGTV